ncbi:MAG: hypothetical protein VX964_07310, partial [Verrucomicrobiota bacterium]|nr:hypothetical protein [Verrucomicrobiota bacterium]
MRSFFTPHEHSPRPSVMPSRFTLKSLLSTSLIICSLQVSNAQNDAGQLGFTALQGQANTLVEKGKLIEAMPLLKELVKRVEASDNSEIKLDFPIFLIGTGHIQQYIASKQTSELSEALSWYDRLEKEFPNSPKIKDMLFKRIDVLRALSKNNEAIELMQKILSGGYKNVRLSQSEQ